MFTNELGDGWPHRSKHEYKLYALYAWEGAHISYLMSDFVVCFEIKHHFVNDANMM